MIFSLRGGAQNTKYYIGGGYNKQESVWKPMDFERYSFRGKHRSEDRKICNCWYQQYSNDQYSAIRPGRQNGGNGTLLQASLNIPTYLPIFADDGTPLKWVNFDNIDVLTSRVNLWSNSYHYIGNAYLTVDILKNLKFHSSPGVDYNNYEENEYWDTRTILGASGGKRHPKHYSIGHHYK